MEDEEHAWHLDKRVNVSIIVILFVQAALGLTWANKLTFEVAQLQKDVTFVKEEVDEKQAERRELTRLVIQLSTQMADAIEEIKSLRLEGQSSRARLWDETRNLRNAIAASDRFRLPNTRTRDPASYPDLPVPKEE